MRVSDFFLLSVFSLASAAGLGQAPAPIPYADVETFLRLALERSPDLAALREKGGALKELVLPAGALPDPMLEGTIQNVGWDRWTVGREDMSMVSVGVRQTLPSPGKRDASREAARAEAAAVDAEIGRLQRQLTFRVRSLCATLYALDKESESLDASREVLDLLAAAATSRYATGQAEQEAVLKTRLEIMNLENRRDDLAAGRKKAAADLNRLTDAPPDRPVGVIQSLPELPAPDSAWADFAEKGSSDVAVKEAEALAARKRLDRVKLDLRPDFGAVGALGIRGGGKDPVVTLGVSLELPFWKKDKQEPAIRAAGHDVERAQWEILAAKADARAEAMRLKADFDRLDRQIARLKDGIIPRTGEAMKAALSAYAAGGGDFAAVLEDFKAWLEARADLVRRDGERFTVLAGLNALVEGR
jgi:outer membrane protein, heavy metal efflux system